MSKDNTLDTLVEENERYEKFLRDEIKVYLNVRVAKRLKRDIDRIAFDNEVSVQDTVIGVLLLGLRVREATGSTSIDEAREALERLLQK